MKDRFSLSFKLFYFIFIGAVGAFTPYINVYLENSMGLTGTQIGLISSLSLIIGVCVIPIWGIAGDKTKKYNALLKFSLAGTLVMVALYYQAATYPMIIVCAIGLELIRLGTTPMADTLATDYCHRTGGNYGSIRGMGSLGYMLAGMFVGFMADHFGLDGPMFATYAALLIIAISISFTFPKDSKKEDIAEDEQLKKGSFKDLLTNKNFLFILFFAMFSVIIVDSAMFYGGNHLINTLGGPESSVSWMTFMTVLPEVAFLMVASNIIKKLGFKKFYIIAMLTIIFRFGVYSITDNLYIFLAASVVHCFGVAVTTVGNLMYIRNSVSPAVLGTAITLLNAALTLGRAIFSYIFGFIYEHGDSYMIFMVSTVAFVLMLLVLLKTKRFDHLDKETV
ncbi:MAG: MFS transporter [Coprobacillaceae bacterium]